MLLTVTNFSDRTCDFAAQRYPLLRFGDDRRAHPPRDRGEPAVHRGLAGARRHRVRHDHHLRAGGPGGPGHRGRKISQFGVALTGRAAPTQVGLDGRAPVHVDPRTATVTYWQPSLDAARKW